MRGLIGRDCLAPGEGLYFPSATFGALHSIGMRFAFDALYLDRRGVVRRVLRAVSPGRLCPWDICTVAAWELAAGARPRCAVATRCGSVWRARARRRRMRPRHPRHRGAITMLRLGILLTVGVLGLSAWSAAGDAMGFAGTPVVAVASIHRAADAPLISSMSASGIGAEGPSAAPSSAVRAPAPSKRTSADAATAGPGDAPTSGASADIPPPTATHAVVAASAGTPPAIAEPMHLWRGLRVPDGA